MVISGGEATGVRLPPALKNPHEDGTRTWETTLTGRITGIDWRSLVKSMVPPGRSSTLQQGLDGGICAEPHVSATRLQQSWCGVIVPTEASQANTGEVSHENMVITSAMEDQRRITAV